MVEEDKKLILAVASANKKSIIVLEGGNSIIVESWKDKVPAILMVYLYKWILILYDKGQSNIRFLI